MYLTENFPADLKSLFHWQVDNMSIRLNRFLPPGKNHSSSQDNSSTHKSTIHHKTSWHFYTPTPAPLDITPSQTNTLTSKPSPQDHLFSKHLLTGISNTDTPIPSYHLIYTATHIMETLLQIWGTSHNALGTPTPHQAAIHANTTEVKTEVKFLLFNSHFFSLTIHTFLWYRTMPSCVKLCTQLLNTSAITRFTCAFHRTFWHLGN